MKSSWLRALGLSVVTFVSLVSLSCGNKQELVSITVNPSGTTFNLTGFGQNLSTQFTAIGNYIHPPVTKDITAAVVWKTDSPSIIFFNPSNPGLVTTTGFACGTNLGVSANMYSNPSNPAAGSDVVGRATVSVTIPSCQP